MKEKLWFVTNGITALSVHNAERDAEVEHKRFQDDPDYEYYDLYEIDVDNLDEYPDEYDLAFNAGFIG